MFHTEHVLQQVVCVNSWEVGRMAGSKRSCNGCRNHCHGSAIPEKEQRGLTVLTARPDLGKPCRKSSGLSSSAWLITSCQWRIDCLGTANVLRRKSASCLRSKEKTRRRELAFHLDYLDEKKAKRTTVQFVRMLSCPRCAYIIVWHSASADF